jgi:hypothetical protein
MPTHKMPTYKMHAHEMPATRASRQTSLIPETVEVPEDFGIETRLDWTQKPEGKKHNELIDV